MWIGKTSCLDTARVDIGSDIEEICHLCSAVLDLNRRLSKISKPMLSQDLTLGIQAKDAIVRCWIPREGMIFFMYGIGKMIRRDRTSQMLEHQVAISIFKDQAQSLTFYIEQILFDTNCHIFLHWIL